VITCKEAAAGKTSCLELQLGVWHESRTDLGSKRALQTGQPSMPCDDRHTRERSDDAGKDDVKLALQLRPVTISVRDSLQLPRRSSNRAGLLAATSLMAIVVMKPLRQSRRTGVQARYRCAAALADRVAKK